MLVASVDSFSWDTLGSDLWATARPYLLQWYALAYEDSSRNLPVRVAFDVDNPMVKVALKNREKLIKGISDTVFEHVKGLVARQSEEGQAPAKLAQAIREYGVTDSKSRSLMIARTESAVAMSQGSVMSYADAGIEKVEVLDGDEDADCAEANGQMWTLEEAMANPVGHPNCTRAFAPVIGE